MRTTTQNTSAAVELGIIAEVVSDRGYGFVRSQKHPHHSWFFHCTECAGFFDTLEVGDKVQFSQGRSATTGQMCAMQIRLIDTPASWDSCRKGGR
jgi:cold shock CspA family protein